MAHRNQKQTVIDLHNRRPDDLIEKRQTQKQLLAIIQQKNTQLSVLNHVNSRLGAELSILQKKLGIDHDIILKELQQINQISAAFHFETEQLVYLDALLTAYDENNIKQKKIIAHLYMSLEDSEKNAQNLVKDNEFLLGELQEKTKQVLQIYSKGLSDDNLANSYAKLQRESQIEMNQNLRSENTYLLNKYSVLQQNFEKLTLDLNEAKLKSDHYFNLYKRQNEDLKQALIKVDDLIKIKDVLEKKFDQITQQNIDFETTKQQLEAKIIRIESERNDYKNKFTQQRNYQYEQSEKLGRDYESLKSDHEASQKRQREYFNKNMLLERDIQGQRQDLKTLRRQLEKTKSDFEQTLKMCEAYESKINIYNKKQTILKESMQDNKQKLEAAILERDKAILKQKQLQKLIESVKQRNRQQMDTLRDTMQKLIKQQNEKIRILQEDTQDMTSVFQQNECSLKHQLQKLRRENQILKEQNNRHVDNVRTSSGHQIINKLKDLQQKNQSLSRLLSQKQRSYKQQVDHKEEMYRSLELQNRDLSKQVDKQRSNAREAINERTQYKSRISILQKQIQCKDEQISRVKKTLQNRTNTDNGQKYQKIRELEIKISSMTKKQKETKEKTIALLEKYNQIQQQMKMEFSNEINQLKTQNLRLQKKLDRK